MFKILDSAVKEEFPVLIVAEDIEQDALAPVIRNKLKGNLKVAAIKAPAFGERKSHCLDDLAIFTGGSQAPSSHMAYTSFALSIIFLLLV